MAAMSRQAKQLVRGALIAVAILGPLVAARELAERTESGTWETILTWIPQVVIGIVAFFLVISLVFYVVGKVAKFNTTAGLVFHQAMANWAEASGREAEEALANARPSVPQLRVEMVWKASAAQVTRLDGSDSSTGERLVVLEMPRERAIKPTLRWIAGMFVRAEDDLPGGTRRRSLRLFERVDCRWSALDVARAAADLAGGGTEPPVIPLGSWRCRDCGVTRLDFINDDRLLITLRGYPQEPEPAWYSGLFFLYARALYPRSVTMTPSWHGPPSRTSSSPPPTTQPS